MTEITLSINGLKLLQENLNNNMQELKKLIDEIDNKNHVLLEALGENDYKGIQTSVNAMQTEFMLAERNLMSVSQFLEDYIRRGIEIRVILNSDGTVNGACKK